MVPVILSLLSIVLLLPVQSGQSFNGTITDAMCPRADHSRMRMGANDAECAIACADAHGAVYVLYDGKETYVLSDQKASEKFAGKAVIVTGTRDAKNMTIQVSSIVPR